MHVLTKIFIVLVTLLALAIVPLVAVHATNEGKYKQRWMNEEAAAASANAKAAALEAQKAAAELALTTQVSELQNVITTLRKESDLKGADLRKLQGELADAKALQADVYANLQILAQSGKQAVTTNQTLVGEVRDLREKVLLAEKTVIELDQTVSTLQSQLEVADAARKAVQEELQKVKEEKMALAGDIAKFRAMFGELPTVTASVGILTGEEAARVPADRDVSTTILGVSQVNGQTIVEINAGSRDGVKEGWTLWVSDGGNYVGEIQIIKVDVNRASGVAKPSRNGKTIAVGQRAVARRGE